jgi:DNA mismatch repair protein MSH2
LRAGAEHEVEVYEDKSGWKLGRTASPGKLGSFEEELFRGSDLADTPVVMAAKLVMRDSQCVVSLAYLNTATREIGATEFVDDHQFCAFDAACVQVTARHMAAHIPQPPFPSLAT